MARNPEVNRSFSRAPSFGHNCEGPAQVRAADCPSACVHVDLAIPPHVYEKLFGGRADPICARDYSHLSATMGSIFMARRAGM